MSLRKRKAELEIESQLATLEAQLRLERLDNRYELPHKLVGQVAHNSESRHVAAD